MSGRSAIDHGVTERGWIRDGRSGARTTCDLLIAAGAELAEAWSQRRLSVIVAREPLGAGGAMRWHLSIAHPDRYPTWDEITAARYGLVPDEVTMVMLLPPRDQYVNLHQHAFHLHEVPESAL